MVDICFILDIFVAIYANIQHDYVYAPRPSLIIFPMTQ